MLNHAFGRRVFHPSVLSFLPPPTADQTETWIGYSPVDDGVLYHTVVRPTATEVAFKIRNHRRVFLTIPLPATVATNIIREVCKQILSFNSQKATLDDLAVRIDRFTNEKMQGVTLLVLLEADQTVNVPSRFGREVTNDPSYDGRQMARTGVVRVVYPVR